MAFESLTEKLNQVFRNLSGKGRLTEGDVKQLYAKAQETAQTAGQDKDTFSIYQINLFHVLNSYMLFYQTLYQQLF